VKNNKITPANNVENIADYRINNAELRLRELGNLNSNFNIGCSAVIALVPAVGSFLVTLFSVSADQSFREAKNQTSFADNLGRGGAYSFAFAISATTFLTTFLLSKCAFEKIDRLHHERNNRHNNSNSISGELVFEHNNQRDSSEHRRHALINLENSELGNVDSAHFIRPIGTSQRLDSYSREK
jgi:hypothetical protein